MATRSDPRTRVLRAVAQLSSDGHPVTLTELVAQLGGHPNSTRAHLKNLLSTEMLCSTTVPQRHAGRRPQDYLLTDAGRAALEADHEAASALGIVRALVDTAPEGPAGREQALAIGTAWGKVESADLLSADDPLSQTMGLLDMLGFEPHPASDGDGVVLRSCPLHSMVQARPEFACTMHEGLIRGVLSRLDGVELLSLVPFEDDQGCRVRLQTRQAT